MVGEIWSDSSGFLCTAPSLELLYSFVFIDDCSTIKLDKMGVVEFTNEKSYSKQAKKSSLASLIKHLTIIYINIYTRFKNRCNLKMYMKYIYLLLILRAIYLNWFASWMIRLAFLAKRTSWKIFSATACSSPCLVIFPWYTVENSPAPSIYDPWFQSNRSLQIFATPASLWPKNATFS